MGFQLTPNPAHLAKWLILYMFVTYLTPTVIRVQNLYDRITGRQMLVYTNPLALIAQRVHYRRNYL